MARPRSKCRDCGKPIKLIQVAHDTRGLQWRVIDPKTREDHACQLGPRPVELGDMQDEKDEVKKPWWID